MIYLVLSNMFLALAIVSSKVALSQIPPFIFVMLRMLIPGIFFLLIGLISKKITWPKDYEAKKALFFMILITSVLPMLLKNYALKKISMAKFAFLCSIEPFVAAFWMFVFFQEYLNVKQVGALFLASFAICLSLFEQTINQSFSFNLDWADCSVIIAVFLAKLGWLIARESVKKNYFSADSLTIFNMMGTGMILAFSTFPLVNLEVFTTIFLQKKILLSFLSASFFYSAGYYVFARCLTRYNFTLIAVAGSCVPFLVGLLGFLQGEALSSWLIFAMILNATAIWLFTSNSMQQRTSSEQKLETSTSILEKN